MTRADIDRIMQLADDYAHDRAQEQAWSSSYAQRDRGNVDSLKRRQELLAALKDASNRGT